MKKRLFWGFEFNPLIITYRSGFEYNISIVNILISGKDRSFLKLDFDIDFDSTFVNVHILFCLNFVWHIEAKKFKFFTGNYNCPDRTKFKR